MAIFVPEPPSRYFIVPAVAGMGVRKTRELPKLMTGFTVYTAFDGWGSVRIGLTSIGLEDFLNKKWNWQTPVLISPPGEIHKNWVIFPEKINGKYAILHSLSPDILMDYFDNLDSFDGKTFIHSVHQNHPKWQ